VSATHPVVAPSGTARRRLAWCLVLLAAAQLIYSLDLNIVFVALPSIGAGLGFSDQSLQWVVGAYAVFAGGFLLLGGRAADLLGRRRVFVAALVLYGVSSLAGGLAADSAAIIAARAVQGIGGALLLPSTLSLIGTLFSEGPARNRALAVWGGTGASGLAIGALLGGVLTQAWGWRAVFFVNVPLAVAVALAALRVIPPDPTRSASRRFDLPGALTVTGGATLFVFALVQGPVSGWGSVSVVSSAVAAVLLIGTFALIEVRTRDPLLPGRLLRNRSLLVGLGITFVYMGTFGALPYFLTILFQQVRGYSALQTGLAFIVPAAAIAIGTQAGEHLTTWSGLRPTLLAGLTIGVAGTAILVPAFSVHASYPDALAGLTVSGIGQGIVWTAMWITVGAGAGPQAQGVANGMASTTLNLGYAIGLAVLIAVSHLATATPGHLAYRAVVARDGSTAVLVATIAMTAGLLVAMALPRRGRASGETRTPLPQDRDTTQSAAVCPSEPPRNLPRL
jgi:MFS family permease